MTHSPPQPRTNELESQLKRHTDDSLSETTTIELYYNEEHSGSWINIGVMVGRTDLGNTEYEVTVLATGIVFQLLESTSVPISGEKYIIELEYGPSWIAVEPRDERSVNLRNA